MAIILCTLLFLHALTQCRALPVVHGDTTPVTVAMLHTTPAATVTMTPPATAAMLQTTIAATPPPQVDTTTSTFIIAYDTTPAPPVPPQSYIISTATPPPRTVMFTTPPAAVVITTTMPPPPQTGQTTGGQPAATTPAAGGCHDKQGKHEADDKWVDKENKVKKVCVNHPKAGYYIATTACMHGDNVDKEVAVHGIVKVGEKYLRCQFDRESYAYTLTQVEAGEGSTSCIELDGAEHEGNSQWEHNNTVSMCRFDPDAGKYSIERLYCYHCKQYAAPNEAIKCDDDGKSYTCTRDNGMLYAKEVSDD